MGLRLGANLAMWLRLGANSLGLRLELGLGKGFGVPACQRGNMKPVMLRWHVYEEQC